MADTNTNRLGLIQMEAGTHLNEWGDILNINIGRLDAAARGFKEIVVTTAQTLDATDITTTSSIAEDESFFQWIELTGTPGVTTAITVQAEEMAWNVYNNTDSIINFTPQGGTLFAMAIGQAYNLVYVAADTAFTDMSAVIHGGAVNTFGTPANNQVAVFTDLDTIEGDVNFAWSGTVLSITGALQVDNIKIDGTTISSTAGTDLLLTPLAGQQLVLDNQIVIDSGVVTGITNLTATNIAGTLTTAAQAGITSLGTLTILNVDNVRINGNTISSTAGTDLLLTPLAGQQLILDTLIIIDNGVLTGATSITSTTFVGALTGEADTVTTNANLTGHITSSGSNATLLGSFSSTQLRTALTASTGTGSAVFNTSPSFTTPALGTPSALVGTNITGTAASLTAGNATLAATVTTNANLNGPVTSSGNTTTITPDSVTFNIMQDIPTANILGRVTAATGTIEDLTSTQATTLINAFTSSLKGLTPSSGGGTTNFLRADGTWTIPAGTGGNVNNVATPLNDQLAVWTGITNIEGTTGLTYNGSALAITGNITLTGTVDGIDIATDVAANTAKTSNVTHTSHVTGATALTVVVAAITGQADIAAAITDLDEFLINDGGVIKRTDASRIKTYIGSSGSSFPSGTLMVFQQTAAPTGWTKETTHNNKALRVVTGAAGSAGATAFTSVFGSGKITGAHAITVAQMPSHSHTVPVRSGGSSSGRVQASNFVTIVGNEPTADTGGDGTHTHTLSIDIQYVDLIIASKNA